MPNVNAFRALRHTNLTTTIDRSDVPRTFLRSSLFSGATIEDKDTLEMGTTSRGRYTAPFTRVGSNAHMIRPRSSKIAQIEFPHIRLKDPYVPGNDHFTRRPGERLYDQSLDGRMQREVAKSLIDMKRDMANTEEWMCSQMVTGTLAYDVAGGDSFTLVHPDKPGVMAPGITWNNTSTAAIEDDFRAVFRAMAAPTAGGGGYQATDCYLPQDSADAFLAVLKDSPLLRRENTTNVGGPISMVNPFTQFGSAQYLGTFMGIRVWEYTAQLVVGGTLVNLIRPKHAEFVSNTPAAENIFYYGPQTDPRAIQSGLTRSRIFSKSWFEEDPGAHYVLASSRPMPFARRPDSMVSMAVLP